MVFIEQFYTQLLNYKFAINQSNLVEIVRKDVGLKCSHILLYISLL